MDSRDLQPGMLIEFEYPRHNFRGVQSSFERRRARVERIRHLVDEPLHQVTGEWQPLLRRDMELAIVFDLDKREQRSFYAGSMRAIRLLHPSELIADGTHTVAVCDSSAPAPSTDREVVFSGSGDAAIAWAREWLKNSLGMTVSIEPPAAKRENAA